MRLCSVESGRLGFTVALLWASSCGDIAFADVLDDPASQPSPIVAGSTDIPEHFAATGALLITTQKDAEAVHTHLCTATLIAPEAIVTAAHCRVEQAHWGPWQQSAPLVRRPQSPLARFEPGLRGSRRTARSMQVWYSFCLMPDVSTQTNASPHHSRHCTPATSFEVHPRFRLPGPWETGLLDAYDVGVLRLAAAPKKAAPAVLLTPEAGMTLAAGQPVSIAGFGSTLDNPAIGRLAQTSGVKRCAKSAINRLSDTEMVVGEPPCPAHKSFGDSGGPTFVHTRQGPRLVGVSSRLQAETDATFGTIDTRLDVLADWLMHTAGSTDAPSGGEEGGAGDGPVDDEDDAF